MQRVTQKITDAQSIFNAALRKVEKTGGLTQDRYVNFLSMQYHLTNDVQKYFFRIAGNSELGHKKNLRMFLVNFGLEEELHYKIAEKDLENMGMQPLEQSLDVRLWFSFYNSVIDSRPFLRLGATCILENIAATSSNEIKRLFAGADFLTPKNSRFFTIHLHGPELPHGDQILDAIASANLDERQMGDVVLGAEWAAIMYLRIFKNAMGIMD